MNASPNPIPTSAADKEKLVSLLRESRQLFLSSFAGVSDQQSRRHPAEGKWSILETVEHLTLAERTLLGRVTESRRARSAATPNREEIFLRAVADRSRKIKTPETARPTGRFASLDEARVQFEVARRDTLQFLEETKEDLRATEVTHPHSLVGVVTTYEMLLIIAKHAERHALQIEEIRKSAAFDAAENRG